MHTEDVSVVMPNYNYGRYLPRAVNAVLSQEIRPKEFYVVDDCSTDDSMQILERLAKQDPLLQVVRNEKNLGVVATINRGLQLISGKYCMFLASDDYILPGMIKNSVALLKKYPQAGLSCGYHSVIKEPSGEILPNPSRWCMKPSFLSPKKIARVIGPHCIPGHTAIYRRDALLNAGGFDPELQWHSDWFANLVIAFRYGICHVPATIALLSSRDTTYSSVGTRNQFIQQEIIRAIIGRLTNSACADVLPFFQSSGAMNCFGENLVIAAASLPNRFSPAVVGLIDGLPVDCYEKLLVHHIIEVRELGRYLLGRRQQKKGQHLEDGQMTALINNRKIRKACQTIIKTCNSIWARISKLPFHWERSR